MVFLVTKVELKGAIDEVHTMCFVLVFESNEETSTVVEIEQLLIEFLDVVPKEVPHGLPPM